MRRSRAGRIGAAVAGVLALGAPAAARAADWWVVYQTDSAMTFVDRDSLGPVSLGGKPYTRLWVYVINRRPDANGVKSTKTLQYLDCKTDFYGRKAGLSFDAKGGVLSEATTADEAITLRPVVPGEPEEYVRGFACAKGVKAFKGFQLKVNDATYIQITNPEQVAAQLLPPD